MVQNVLMTEDLLFRMEEATVNSGGERKTLTTERSSFHMKTDNQSRLLRGWQGRRSFVLTTTEGAPVSLH